MNSFVCRLGALMSLLVLSCKPEPAARNFPPYDVQVVAQLERVTGTRLMYRLTASAKDTEGDPLRFDWDFGNGTTKPNGAASETVELADNQTYPITVRVTDGHSAPVPATTTVQTQTSAVVLDWTKHYQTIEGFGGFGSQDVYWGSGPYTTPEFVRLVVEDLGLTIAREEVVSSLEPVNDNDDPNVTDLSRFNLDQRPTPQDHVPFGTRVPHLRALRAAGVRKFIASVWSPPVWMKHNGRLGNGTQNQNSAPPYTRSPTDQTNQLRPELLEEFAEFCAAYCQIFEREVGVPLYALSIQNEPRFSQFYQSCVYDGPALRETLRMVGRRFRREGIQTKLFLPEDIQWTDAMRNLLMPSLEDPEVRGYVDIVAVHGYAFDGVQPNSPDAGTWRTMAGWGAPYGKPLWMTETSGFADTHEGALKLAGAMHNALRYGHAEAWVFWTLAEPTRSAYSLFSKTLERSKRYYVSKNFYRYVRPGAVRAEASAGDETILPLAFAEGNRQVLILINVGTTDRVVKLSGAGLKASFRAYRTSETENCQDLGTYSGPAVILPRQSVTTWVSE